MLINLPDEHSVDPMLDAPLGLMYISSYLKMNGIRTKILDLSMFEKPYWKYKLTHHPRDVYGITINSPSFPTALEVANIIKDRLPDALVVAGGPHPTAKPFDVLETGSFDYVVRGEGEEAMKMICKAKPRNRIISYENSPEVIDIFPDRSGVSIYNYTRSVDGKPSCSMITSRGCPYNCVFCSSHLMWNKMRFRSLRSINEEFKQIKELGFEAVHFWDDTFTLKPKRLVKILEMIKKWGFTFRCNGNLRTDTYQRHKALYDAGCREYCVGVESGSQTILDNINKRTTVERNKQVIEDAMKAGLIVKAYLMVGSPGETWDTVEETREFMEEVHPHQWTLFNFVPMPGCDVYEHPEKYKIKKDDIEWQEYFCIGGDNVGGLTHSTEKMSKEEIEEARKYLLNHLPKQKGKLQKYYDDLL